MNPLLVAPDRFLGYALTQEGKPYGWNAKGPGQFDCSGLVTYAIKLAGGPDLRANWNCEVLFNRLQPLGAVKPGEVALALYGKLELVAGVIRLHHGHVMITVGDGRVFGSCGGGPETVTIADAKRDDACVRYRRTATYRADLLGFRELRYRSAFSGGSPNA